MEQTCCLSGLALEVAVRGRVVLVDRTDVPTGNCAVGGRESYSEKQDGQGLNVPIASDLNGILLCVSDPVPGARHDDNTRATNRYISFTRSAVERCIAHRKNVKILATGYRGRLTEPPQPYPRRHPPRTVSTRLVKDL